jgi:serine/threonine protein kinase
MGFNTRYIKRLAMAPTGQSGMPFDRFSLTRSATHIESGTEVAIKKVGSKNFEEVILAKRALRELKLLRHLNGHENVLLFS